MVNFWHKTLSKLLIRRETLAKIFGEYFAVGYLKIYWLAAGAANLLLWLAAWLMRSSIEQDLVILHYNTIFGIDWVGNPNGLFWLPAAGAILLALNIFVSFFFYRRDKFLVHLLFGGALLANFIIALALYSLFLVNSVKISF